MNQPDIEVTGEAFLRHFAKHLGVHCDECVFDAVGRADLGSMRVLRYRGVFEDSIVSVSTTLGYSRIGSGPHRQELVIVTVGEQPELVWLLARTLFIFAEYEVILEKGTYQLGFEQFDQDFVARTGKSGFYFSWPWQFPEAFKSVHIDIGAHGRMLTALPISRTEGRYIKEFGPDAFEDKLAMAEVDLLDVTRDEIIQQRAPDGVVPD